MNLMCIFWSHNFRNEELIQKSKGDPRSRLSNDSYCTRCGINRSDYYNVGYWG